MIKPLTVPAPLLPLLDPPLRSRMCTLWLQQLPFYADTTPLRAYMTSSISPSRLISSLLDPPLRSRRSPPERSRDRSRGLAQGTTDHHPSVAPSSTALTTLALFLHPSLHSLTSPPCPFPLSSHRHSPRPCCRTMKQPASPSSYDHSPAAFACFQAHSSTYIRSMGRKPACKHDPDIHTSDCASMIP